MKQEISKGRRMGGATLASGNQPIFYFDGAFRTWAQVEQRAHLKRAIATVLASHPAR